MPKQLANTVNSVISRNIKKCRLKAFPGHGGGRRCAAAFGVAPSQWSHWENERRLPDEYVRSRLAEFFAIPETEFLNPSFVSDTVAVKEFPPSKDFRRINALGDMTAMLSENVIAEVSRRLTEQIAPAVIDTIVAQVTPAIVNAVCRKLAGISFMATGGDGAAHIKPNAGKFRSARASK